MPLSNHSHHNCPSCPYRFHQRACCSIVITGAAITPVSYASAGQTTTLLSLLFTPLLLHYFQATQGSAPVQVIWRHRNALTSVRRFWEPSRGHFYSCCQEFSITANTYFLKTDSLLRSSFSLHIFINMLLQFNRALSSRLHVEMR